MSMKIVPGGKVEVSNTSHKAALPDLNLDHARKEVAAATQPSPATQPSALSNEAQAAAIQAQNVGRAVAPTLKVVDGAPDASKYLVPEAA